MWKQGGGGRTYFLYDGSEPVCELNGSGSLTAVTDFGADGVWARHTTTTDWFYTFDPQGCMSQKIGRDGSVLCSSIYDAQGHEATTDTQPDPFSGYGGQWGYYADWETSGDNGGSCLFLLGHRFYDPNAGRFINRDPIDYAGGINLYAYVGNNPVNEGDPSGHGGAIPWPVARGGAGGAIGLAAYLLLLWCMRHPEFCFGPIHPPTTAPPPSMGGPVSVGKPVHDPGELGLPTGNCPNPYIPPKTWKPGNELPGRNVGGKPEYKDDDGNYWRKSSGTGGHHFPGDGYEWDVQTGNGNHINVGRGGGQAPGVIRGPRR